METDHEAAYLTEEINKMRRVMQDHGMWDEFCTAYAASYPVGARMADLPSDRMLDAITRAVRGADRQFEREGGSSRHWVRDCFLPELNALGLIVIERPLPRRPVPVDQGTWRPKVMATELRRGELVEVACPHCGKPLKVQWEVWRVWDVMRSEDGKLLLSSEPVEFEGGTCQRCGDWVDLGHGEIPNEREDSDGR